MGSVPGADPPSAVCVQDVLVVPFVTSWVGGPDPARIPEHGRMRLGRDARFNDAFPDEARSGPSVPLAGSYLYAGPYLRHFGHILTDSVARLWAFDPGVHTSGVLFANHRRNRDLTPARFVREVLSAFGVHRSKIHILDAPIMVERLWFAPPGALPRAEPAAWYWDRLAAVESRLLDRASPGLRTHDRLFVGRTHIRRGGTFMGESYFEAVLARNGFAYLKPETLTVADQVATMRAARRIVFTEGSAAHITELMTPFDGRVSLLLRRPGGQKLFRPHLAPRCAFDVAGLRSDVRRLPLADGGEGPSAPSYHLHPELTHADLVRQGMIAPEPFDASAYLEAEREDALDYFGERSDVAEAQLALVANLRGGAL